MTNKTRLILKLKDIVISGYFPSRGLEKYSGLTKYNQRIEMLGNCFEHAVFNLTNDHFNAYDINSKEGEVFGDVAVSSLLPKRCRDEELRRFVRSTGLIIEESKPDALIKNNQWIVALYFENDFPFDCDFHFIRKERNGLWTGKRGYTDQIQKFDFIPNRIHEYELYKTFKVTNPYAREK